MEFPALAPVARRYTLGQFPYTIERGFAGGDVRFLHGYRMVNHTMELEFRGLTYDELAGIRDHYRYQNGGYKTFFLPDKVWEGNDHSVNLGIFQTLWRYAAEPEEEHTPAGYCNVTVQLVGVAT